MTILKATNWLDKSGNVINAPIRFSSVVVPYSTGSASSASYIGPESSYTTSNTTSLYSWTYTPVSSSSYITFIGLLYLDRSSSGSQERLCMFMNNTCMAVSYLYPRAQGHEGYNYQLLGTYTNSSTSAVTFDIRFTANWTVTLGGQYGANDTEVARTVQIFEYQR
jgi:hypothetical protein